MKTFDEWFDNRNFDPSLYSPMSHAWSAGCGTSAEKLQAYRRATLELEQQRDGLVAALELMLNPTGLERDRISAARAALAKVGAGKTGGE